MRGSRGEVPDAGREGFLEEAALHLGFVEFAGVSQEAVIGLGAARTIWTEKQHVQRPSRVSGWMDCSLGELLAVSLYGGLRGRQGWRSDWVSCVGPVQPARGPGHDLV